MERYTRCHTRDDRRLWLRCHRVECSKWLIKGNIYFKNFISVCWRVLECVLLFHHCLPVGTTDTRSAPKSFHRNQVSKIFHFSSIRQTKIGVRREWMNFSVNIVWLGKFARPSWFFCVSIFLLIMEVILYFNVPTLPQMPGLTKKKALQWGDWLPSFAYRIHLSIFFLVVISIAPTSAAELYTAYFYVYHSFRGKLLSFGP